MDKHEVQLLEIRYIDKGQLSQELERLFGRNWEVEVSESPAAASTSGV